MNEPIGKLTIAGAAMDLKKPLRCIKTSASRQVRISSHPFAEGATRLARHGQVVSAGGDAWKNVVLKDFKLQGDGVHAQQRYLRHMEEANLTVQLAQLYAKVKPQSDPPIRFVTTAVV